MPKKSPINLQANYLGDLLNSYKNGTASTANIQAELESYFYSKQYVINKSIAFDSYRQKNSGVAEAIFSSSKTAKQIALLLTSIAEKTSITKKQLPQPTKAAKLVQKTSAKHQKTQTLPTGLLLTKLSTEKHAQVIKLLHESNNKKLAAQIFYNEEGQIGFTAPPPISKNSRVAIVAAGTSDNKICKEIEISLAAMGVACSVFIDVGVAGLGRLLGKLTEIEHCQLFIVVAGMEAALASVLASLSTKPIIAVPSSVGYGSSFGGVAALLGLLNSCAPGITVVNIDGGFQAAAAATKTINTF